MSSSWGTYRRRFEAARIAERIVTAQCRKENKAPTIDKVLVEAKRVDDWLYKGEVPDDDE